MEHRRGLGGALTTFLIVGLGGAALSSACGSNGAAGGSHADASTDGASGGDDSGNILRRRWSRWRRARDIHGRELRLRRLRAVPGPDRPGVRARAAGGADPCVSARRRSVAAEHERPRSAVASAAGAALFEVDFENAATDVRVETPCVPVAAVRTSADGGTQYSGCGLTLSQQQWNDIANTNRDGDPLKVTVRATPGGQLRDARPRRA